MAPTCLAPYTDPSLRLAAGKGTQTEGRLRQANHTQGARNTVLGNGQHVNCPSPAPGPGRDPSALQPGRLTGAQAEARAGTSGARTGEGKGQCLTAHCTEGQLTGGSQVLHCLGSARFPSALRQAQHHGSHPQKWRMLGPCPMTQTLPGPALRDPDSPDPTGPGWRQGHCKPK